MPDKSENQLKYILMGTVLLNLASSFLASLNMTQVLEDTFRLSGALCLLVFVCLHGWHQYGWGTLILFFSLTFVLSWSMESLSIVTGFPFGHYHYAEELGDKLGNVPLMIMPAYFFVGYLTWMMSRMFVGDLGKGIEKRNVFLIPFVASWLMVLWDACFDPIMSTIGEKWIWEEGGAYYGVPVSNFAGWFLTVYLIFQSFSFYLYKYEKKEKIAAEKSYWYLVPMMYMGQALPYFLYPFFRRDHLEIYRAMSLVTVLTMFLAVALNLVMVHRHLKRQEQLQNE